MLTGLRDEFLKSQEKMESNIVWAVEYRVGEMSRGSQEWYNYWLTILKFYVPELNNVYLEGSGGDIKVNRIFSSEPGSYIYELADFFMRTMFSESTPWFKGQFLDDFGRVIKTSELSLAAQKFSDDAVDYVRSELGRGNFYDAGTEGVLHYHLLGMAPLMSLQSESKISYVHLPIHRVPILTSKDKEVIGVCTFEVLDEWEIRREYGDRGWALFSETNNDVFRAAAQESRMPQGNYISPVGGGGLSGASGGNRISSAKGQNAKEIVKLFVPNKDYMGIHKANFHPEMEYICFVLTRETRRLLDVELYPTKPFGVAQDIQVAGELYSRSTCGRLLPDVAVLNKKKNAELVVDSLVSQSPLVVTGRGFERAPGKGLRPWQFLHMKPDTKLEALFQNNSLYQRTRSIYESELETLRSGLRRDKMNVTLADRMSAQEYQQRQDAAWGIFQPSANRLFRHMALPILKATLNYGILKGALPPVPEEVVTGQAKMELAMVNGFAYGQASDRGQNLARALGPLAGLIEKNPEVMAGFNAVKYLRSSLADFELSEFTSTDEEVEAKRQQDMEREAAGRGAQLGPEQKAEQAAIEGQLTGDIAGERIIDYHGYL